MSNRLNDEALDTLFRAARTYNGYVSGEVSENDIHEIYELMKMGPTSANQQPGRFVWVLSQEAKDKLAGLVSAGNAPKIKAAPATVVIGYDTEFHENLPEFFPHAPDAKSWFGEPVARERAAFLNTTLQGAYFLLAARALGFDTGPMTGFDNTAVDQAFFAEQPNYRSVMISTLGHGDASSIFGRLPRPEFARFNTIV